MTACSFN